MSRARGWIGAIAGLALLVGGLVVSGCGEEEEVDYVCPVDAKCPASITPSTYYAKWAEAWWRWALSFPASKSPIEDKDGSSCALKQPRSSDEFGKAWFLAGTGSGAVIPTHRECEVPDDRGFFFPIVNAYCVACKDKEDCDLRGEPCDADPAGDDYLLNKCLAGLFDEEGITKMEVRIDGKLVQDIFNYRATTGVFEAMADKDDPAMCMAPESATKGRRISADGYWLFVEPLPPGQHTIEFSAKLKIGFELGVKYTLDVKPADAFYKQHPELL
jgi:hypothetical protein